MAETTKVKIRVKGASKDPVSVPFLGSFVPGKWETVERSSLEEYENNYGKISDKFEDETLVEVEGVKSKERPKKEEDK